MLDGLWRVFAKQTHQEGHFRKMRPSLTGNGKMAEAVR